MDFVTVFGALATIGGLAVWAGLPLRSLRRRSAGSRLTIVPPASGPTGLAPVIPLRPHARDSRRAVSGV
jgi:hypothetical protein